MNRAALSGLIVLLLAASFASAATFLRPAALWGGADDFCSGYAICK